MPDVNAYLKSIGANPTGDSTTKKKKKGPNVDGYIESIKKYEPAPQAKPTAVIPTPEVTVKKNRVIEDFKNKPTVFQAIGQTIDKLTSRPDYEKKPASTSPLRNTLRELPSSFLETLLPPLKYVRDNEAGFTNVSNKDIAKEIPKVAPGAALEVGKEFVKAPISGALELPNYATAGKYQPEISFNIPGLGEVNNSDFRIARRVEQGEDPLTAVISEKSTGLLNALFFASLAAKPFVPRQVSVTGKVKAPEGIDVKVGPKSFRLYQPPTANKPLTPEFIAKMQADGVKLGPKFDPAQPTYFRLSSSGGNVFGEVIQVKPSYFRTLMNVFKGDISKAPKGEVTILNTQKVNPEEIKKVNVLDNKNYKAPSVEQTIKGHIAEAADVVSSGAGSPADAIARAKTNIVDGIKTLSPKESARVAKIDTTGMTSLAQFEQAVFPAKAPVTAPAIVPPIVTPKIDNYLKAIGAEPVKPMVSQTEIPMSKAQEESLALNKKELEQQKNYIPKFKEGDKVVDTQGKTFIVKSFGIENGKVKYYVYTPGKKSSNAHQFRITETDLSLVKAPTTKSTTLTLKPSEAKTPEAKIEEKKTLGTEDIKTLVKKSDIKTLIENSPEFKANPVLTVDAAKNLTFKGKNQQFEIQAEALGLNEMNLKVGDKIEVDTVALKAKGAEQQMRVYKGGTALASVGQYKTGEPINLGNIDKVKPVEMPELVQLIKDISGLTPKVKTRIGGQAEIRGMFRPGKDGQIDIRADLFTPENLKQAEATLAHELGHLVDWLPDKTLKRGNLMGRLSTLNEFNKDFFAEAGVTRSEPEVREQMFKLSKMWRPYDENAVSPSFNAYRKSAKEIYADFVSVLLNNPKLAGDTAPAAYNIFFKMLDKKPAVRDAYFDLQAMLSGDRDILIKARREGVNQMFKEGEYKADELQRKLQAEEKEVKNNFWSKFKMDLVSKNYAVIDRVKQLEKKGQYINPDDDPRYLLEERNYLSGKIKAFTEGKIDPIYKNLQKANLSWDKEFAEALFYKRIIDGDRSKVANPRGISKAVAEELYTDLRNGLSAEQRTVLDESLASFQKVMREVTDEAYKEGLYTPELYKTITDNPTYATFQVLDYLEEGLTSKIYKSIGTLKDISNPATATIQKAIKTFQAIERNKTTKSVITTLKDGFPEDVMPANSVYNGRKMEFKDPKDPDFELITFLKAGKPEGFYVDKYIANSINNESVGGNNVIIKLLQLGNSKVFRPVFIGFNLKFQAANLLRDFFRFYKNTPGISLKDAVKRYTQAVPAARVRAFGPEYKDGKITEADQAALETVLEMEGKQILSITYNDLILSDKVNLEATQIERLLSKYGNDPIIAVSRNPVLRYVKDALTWIKNMGDLIETIPKVAGFYELRSRGPIGKEEASFIRKNIGSPDFLDRGLWAPATNEIFLFSNAITQGWRADLATGFNSDARYRAGGTRSGYWWKTFKINFLPKLLMWGAGLGLFGAKIKEVMDSISEYDKTNYTTVPLGQDKNGKTVYLRLPQDETGRVQSAIMWKILNNAENKQSLAKQVADVFNLLGGQLPVFTPTVGIPIKIFQFASGQNPYDAFRGRNVLSDDVFEAGGSRAVKEYSKYLFQQAGGSIFWTFNTEPVKTDKSIPEKIFNNPSGLNIMGRFIKVSNFGATEELRQAKEEVSKKEAERRLQEKDFSNGLISDLREGKAEKGDIMKTVNQYVLDNYETIDEKVKAQKRLLDKLEMASIRSLGVPEINELTYAETNAQKAAILKKLESTKSTAEFKELVDKITELGIITEGLVIEFNKLK